MVLKARKQGSVIVRENVIDLYFVAYTIVRVLSIGQRRFVIYFFHSFFSLTSMADSTSI